MVSIGKILLPVDFSERSPGAAHYTRTLARHFNSSVHVMHVLPSPDYAVGGVEVGVAAVGEYFANRREQVAKDLSSFAESELGDLQVNTILYEGDPARHIVEYAHQEKINLIVMPTHGYGPFRRFILGSVTAKVLHDADCPVWTGVHLAESPPADQIEFRNIICAIDLGAMSKKTLCWAAQFAAEYNARLTIVHAAPPVEIGQSRYFDPAWRLALIQQAKDEIAKLQESLGSRADVVVDPGEAQKVVRAVAEEGKADVVVIGRGTSAGVFGRLRANAYAIIRESPCPVVSV
jgi:nucleotide-binding universal stress UspA family protein